MESKSVVSETIISGFAHFVWIMMFIYFVSEIDAKISITDLLTLNIGFATLLATFIFGISLFLGFLDRRIFADLSSLVCKPPNLSKMNKACKKKTEEAQAMYASWGVKSFYRSIASAGFIILIMSSCLNNKYDFGKEYFVFLIIGIPIEILTIIAFITQRKDFISRQKDILKD